MKRITIILACLASFLIPVATPAAPAAAAGNCISQAAARNYWTGTQGIVLYGRSGWCSSLNGAFKKWRIVVNCSSGGTKWSTWHYGPSAGYARTAYCTYPGIPTGWSFSYSS